MTKVVKSELETTRLGLKGKFKGHLTGELRVVVDQLFTKSSLRPYPTSRKAPQRFQDPHANLLCTARPDKPQAGFGGPIWTDHPHVDGPLT